MLCLLLVAVQVETFNSQRKGRRKMKVSLLSKIIGLVLFPGLIFGRENISAGDKDVGYYENFLEEIASDTKVRN